MEKKGYFEPKVPLAKVLQSEFFIIDNPYSLASFSARRSEKKARRTEAPSTIYPSRSTLETENGTTLLERKLRSA
jgi:hypothetical protein